MDDITQSPRAVGALRKTDLSGRSWPQLAALLLALAFFLLYWAVFAAAASAADGFPAKYRVGFDWETAIPLLPWTALTYLSLNLMAVPLLLTFPTVRSLLPVLAAVAVELAIATVFFVVCPVENGFRDPAVAGMGGAILGLARAVALQHNYFPSLHVTLAFTGAATVGQRMGGGRRVALYAWASLIALSTLTTHQHYLVDILGGMALAALGFHLVYLPLSRR